MTRQRLAQAFMAGAIVVVAALVAAPAQAQDKLPFTDTNAQGYIALCDRDGTSVTSGKLTDLPFVWKAISSEPAPKGYSGDLARATLAVYQPRMNVDPGEWSGMQFTASSTFTNPKHPVAQGTNVDPALVDLTSVAPLWDGLLQLRFIYSNVDTVVHSKPYPATVIKVTGDSWTVVSGGTLDCGASSGVSDITRELPASAIPSQSPTLVAQPTAISSTEPDAAGGSASAVPSGSPAPTEASGGSSLVAATSPAGGGAPVLLVGALIALPLLGVAAGFFLARRRPSGSS